MATFADDEDIDFEELWGSGGGGVDVNGTLVKVEGPPSGHNHRNSGTRSGPAPPRSRKL